jgi:hypothetical protein
MFQHSGGRVSITVTGGETSLVLQSTVAATLIPITSTDGFDHVQEQSAPYPEDAVGWDEWVKTAFDAPLDPVSVRLGHVFTETEFRRSDERTRWWRGILTSMWGQDILACLSLLDPTARLGANVGAGHSADIAQMDATREHESRLLGKIEMFAAVWVSLTKSLPTPLTSPQAATAPRRGSTPAPHSSTLS